MSQMVLPQNLTYSWPILGMFLSIALGHSQQFPGFQPIQTWGVCAHCAWKSTKVKTSSFKPALPMTLLHAKEKATQNLRI